MPRLPTLTFDRGTLILHPPPRGKAWINFATWDDRIEKFRVPALHYRELVQALHTETSAFVDTIVQSGVCFEKLAFTAHHTKQPYTHQLEALQTWQQAGCRGVVVLPTGAGKSYLAQMVMETLGHTTLIVVPTLDLMHQWYANLQAAFVGVDIGLLGGGSHDRSPILIATYDSAAIHAETLGNRYALVIFDECHHLPSDFNRVIAEYLVAPYRLGLTATPERSDGKHIDLVNLIGAEVYRKNAGELSGIALAEYEIRQIKVKLSDAERDRYNENLAIRNRFLRQSNLSLGGLQGWQRFVQVSARSAAGRQAMLAHHEAKAIALGTEGKIQVLTELLAAHYPEQVLVFTNDNATVYRISQDFLIPAITHQTPVKERHDILDRFRQEAYKTIVVANVLDEGVDVPDVRIAIFLAGTGSTRQFIQRLGRVLRRGSQSNKQAILYEVVAENTVEEGTSNRRRQQSGNPEPGQSNRQNIRQLELVPPIVYGDPHPTLPKAAEPPATWEP